MDVEIIREARLMVYAFDETLTISGGPGPLEVIVQPEEGT